MASRSLLRALAATGIVAVLGFTAACGSSASNSSASDSAQSNTVTAGKLTIATGDPAYEPWVMNNKPESGEGFEAAVAYAVADKLGFKKADVKWVRTPFDAAIAPGAKNWDMNIQQFSITSERKNAVDFSPSYYKDTQSVVVKKDSKYAGAKSLADLKGAKIGVMVGTSSYDVAADKITKDLKTFNDNATLAQALDANQLDALVIDTVDAVYMVQSDQVKNSTIVGRIAGSEDKEGLGIITPKGSKLTADITKAMNELNNDGTIKQLQDKWLKEYTTDLAELK